MSFMSSLTDYIEQNPQWQALVGENFFPIHAPQGATGNWVVYKLDDLDREYSLDGPDEMRMADVVFRVESDSYNTAHEIGELLFAILSPMRGPVGDMVVDHTLYIKVEDYENKDEVLGLYAVLVTASIWHTFAYA